MVFLEASNPMKIPKGDEGSAGQWALSWETHYQDVNWSYSSVKKKSIAPIICSRLPYHCNFHTYGMRPMLRLPSTRQEYVGESSKHPSQPTSTRSETTKKEDRLLNSSLAGVKIAEAALEKYEQDAGFHHNVMPDLKLGHMYKAQSQDLSSPISKEDVDSGKLQWAELVKEFVGVEWREALARNVEGYRPQSSTPSEYDSERSADSDPLPLTPTQKKSLIDIAVRPTSPISGSRGVTPSKTMHGPLSSFAPISASPTMSMSWVNPTDPVRSTAPSPTFSNFTFPSINANYQYFPPSLKKDEQGFYTTVTPPGSPSKLPVRLAPAPFSVLLPPFLSDLHPRNRKVSKTREIIDQLRSASAAEREKTKSRVRPRPRSAASERDRTFHSSSPSLVGETDSRDSGLAETIKEDDADAKARRTHELVQALNRPRPSSFDVMTSQSANTEKPANATILPVDGSKSALDSPTQPQPQRHPRKAAARHTRKPSSISSTSSSSIHSHMPYPLLASSPTAPKPFPHSSFHASSSVPYPMQFQPHPTARPGPFHPMYSSMYPLSYGAPPPAFQQPTGQIGPSSGGWVPGYPGYPPPPAATVSF
ncbi:hypothetical protein SERLA73DRAFT_71773 [Serpula lacrymans var. lacrymans S7.3]|uniref:Uncharacterized protein n=2 Tax=Serpula lacrymans var. lacrymans TaxID=341189 RepID=F8PSP2_SERL3|nr:hypothetical protein SERLA73DRAFT_71773 [Serpula lacrymans var. lacrymans S7.3]